MIIRNRISVGWLTAQPERLKRFMSLSNIEICLQVHRHCERSEAIHSSACGPMDCFIAYAPRNDSRNLERQRRDHPDLLGRIDLLHAERDHLGAITDAAC